MPSYIPQDKSHHPATSENHQYSSRRHPSMDNISPIQQLPLSTSYFVPSVSDPVHTEPRGKLLEKKENPPASPDFIWIAQWSRASRNGQTLPEKLFWKEVSDISCLCPPTILLGSPVGASDFLGWLLKEETSPLFSVAPLGMGSILLFQRSPPPPPACPVLASLLLATWKLSHPMVQGWLDFSLPGGPCRTASRCFLAPLGVGAPHPPPSPSGSLGDCSVAVGIVSRNWANFNDLYLCWRVEHGECRLWKNVSSLILHPALLPSVMLSEPWARKMELAEDAVDCFCKSPWSRK